jgi:hypothetical protein
MTAALFRPVTAAEPPVWEVGYSVRVKLCSHPTGGFLEVEVDYRGEVVKEDS